MFRVPGNSNTESLKLAEVLDDIGVTEKMVLKRRRSVLLMETIATMKQNITDVPCHLYMLGSQSEGALTSGLYSDRDVLVCENYSSVIQDWNEWTLNRQNLLMVQDENNPPGYCFLQIVSTDVPLPSLTIQFDYEAKDVSGRILLKNTVIDSTGCDGEQRQGPSLSTPGPPGTLTPDTDLVVAFPCKSWPHIARKWLEQTNEDQWPTAEMKVYARTSRCCVVAVGSKISSHEECEWRISTTLAERCLMFNLNITQLKCYILMKMILKTFINPRYKGFISSFMCKTVLFHCIRSKHPSIWRERNLSHCLSFCLLTLYNCILTGNCPHFIIYENNLMAGKLTREVKHELLELFSNMIQNIVTRLFGIQIDDLGLRLKIKLNNIQTGRILQTSMPIKLMINESLLKATARCLYFHYLKTLLPYRTHSVESTMQFLSKAIKCVTKYYTEGSTIEKAACKLIAPLLCTSMGSIAASNDIGTSNTVSPQSLAWFSAGLNSDVSSSRLKYASMFYCTGEMENALYILEDIRQRYNEEYVDAVCHCIDNSCEGVKEGFSHISDSSNEEAIRNTVAFCVAFHRSEVNCVPHELQYELYRSTTDELDNRNYDDNWMSCAAIDSLPYLFFIQYKTYSNLQRHQQKKTALIQLWRVISREQNLGHRETALNLLGQCFEQEYNLMEAIRCYISSLQLRPSNNAARIHICVLLSKLVNSR
ncbi:uncharacterized protein LOC123545779 [Mercenaria mercenaria]|uniref:uncharacterized protein LOC123545779 n=1 Tax=Mercenaria mercenaria TaxID=6596 RepID=UPI00234EF02D|nr:uncharacterized protein LOC123545779 [Mercenaria mercenaria]